MPNDFPDGPGHGLFGWGPSELGGFPYWDGPIQCPRRSPVTKRAWDPSAVSMTERASWPSRIKGGPGRLRTRPCLRGRTCTIRADVRTGCRVPSDMVRGAASAPRRPQYGRPDDRRAAAALAEDFFGWGSSADWVASISSISGC